MMTEEELQEALNWRKTDKLIEGMLSHIDELTSRIDTLKAALISERAYICSAKVIETMPMDGGFIGMAKDQLAQEYPEIFAEEKE